MSVLSNFQDQSENKNARDSSFALAVAVIRERIDSLPQDDKDDLYSLLPQLFSDDREEQEAAQRAFREILDQRKAVVIGELPEGSTESLDNWISFVSKRIKECRTKAGLTQEALADASGLPQSHISRLENGEHSPTAKTLLRIASALGIPVTDLDPSAEH